MGGGIIGLVKKLKANKTEYRKPSAFPTQNNKLCSNPDCDWEGDGENMPYKGMSTILCCPECGGIHFKAVLKPEFAKLPPIDVPAPFEGERKHRYEDGWRIY